jgi:hypothetical protein
MSQQSFPSDQALSLRAAADWIACHTGVKKPHASTMTRWATRGVKGVRLQVTRVGAKLWTTPGSLAEFLDALNARTSPESVPATPETFQAGVRRHQIESACMHLDALCANLAQPVAAQHQPKAAAGSAYLAEKTA